MNRFRVLETEVTVPANHFLAGEKNHQWNSRNIAKRIDESIIKCTIDHYRDHHAFFEQPSEGKAEGKVKQIC